MKERLLSLFVRHNTAFKSLSSIALSQLILKILFISKTSSSIGAIKDEVMAVVNGSVRVGDIQKCLIVLAQDEKIVPDGKYYKLSNSTIKLLEDQEQNFKSLFDDVLNYWFGEIQTTKEILGGWFDFTLQKFFEEFHYDWINELKKEKRIRKNKAYNLEKLIEESINDFNKTHPNDREWLKKRFILFIDSARSEDNKLLWMYGTTRFSAKLINARLFTDSIPIEMFKKSNFIIDTNVLMILGLEGFELSNSFRTLEDFFKKFNIGLKFLSISDREYVNAIDALQKTCKNVFAGFRREVLEELAKKNPHIKTILARGCRSEEDVENFFSQFTKIPEFFYEDYKIEKLDNAEIEENCQKAIKDETLKQNIDKINRELKRKNKRPNALSHDAALIKVTEYLRQYEKCWILTRDTTIINYAINHRLRDDEPIAISLMVLMSLITYSNYDFDSENLAPLFATLVQLSLFPEENTFTIEDFQFILDTKIDINKLPDDAVISIAQELNRARMNNCSDEEATLLLQRSFQREKFDIETDLEKTKKDYELEHSLKLKAEQENQRIINNLRIKRTDELTQKYNRDILINKLLFLLGLPLLLVVSFYFIFNYLLSTNLFLAVSANILLSFLLTILTSNFVLKPRILKKYSDIKIEIPQKVEDEIKSMVQE